MALAEPARRADSEARTTKENFMVVLRERWLRVQVSLELVGVLVLRVLWSAILLIYDRRGCGVEEYRDQLTGGIFAVLAL